MHDPLPVLRSMEGSSIICMGDGPIANAGVLYARPGSAAALALLEDVAWRVQLFQFWPEFVPKVVPFARPPFYANSDDQTILNDAIISAVLGRRTFLGSTARFEARNRYNVHTRVVWEGSPAMNEYQRQLRDTHRRGSSRFLTVPWAADAASNEAATKRRGRHRYQRFALAGSNDSVAIAPRVVFAHLPFDGANAMTHLTAARGFRAKVSALQKLDMWHPSGVGPPPATTHQSAVGLGLGVMGAGGTGKPMGKAGGGARRAGGGGGRAGGAGGMFGNLRHSDSTSGGRA
mmetsp:Transcript_34756/g.87332  ORF Transcript_34756/g.87332 Transcript_34756/m.87332 type:complete len:289 (-) Transcript_34756:281-1147(-)